MKDIKVGDWIKTKGGGAVAGIVVTGGDLAWYREEQRRGLIEEVRSPAPEPCVWRTVGDFYARSCDGSMSYWDPSRSWKFCPYCGKPLQIAEAPHA